MESIIIGLLRKVITEQLIMKLIPIIIEKIVNAIIEKLGGNKALAI